LNVKSGQQVLLHLTRSGGEALDIPVVIGEVARQTRFSRCYAPLSLMRRIRRWQDTPHATAAEIFNASDDDPAFVYDTALVYARSVGDVPSIRKELEKLGYRTASILDSVKRYRQIMLVAGVVLTSLGLIALFTGSVSIFNAAYAAVMRRMREFAIYKTYGATRAAIVAIVLTEAVITAIVSGILGFAAGGGVCLLLQHFVRSEVDSVLFPVEWWLAVVAFATACVASLAASIIPALRAARLSPTEALRA
jgi:ABC-type antimicrobial peptide transport system permease subunit